MLRALSASFRFVFAALLSCFFLYLPPLPFLVFGVFGVQFHAKFPAHQSKLTAASLPHISCNTAQHPQTQPPKTQPTSSSLKTPDAPKKKRKIKNEPDA